MAPSAAREGAEGAKEDGVVSGGSLNYVHRSMADGELDKFMRYGDEILSELRRARDKLLAGECDYWSSSRKETVRMAPDHVLIVAVASQCARVEMALVACQQARAAIAAIDEDTVNEIDRWGSGDVGPGEVVRAAHVALCKTLGLPVPP